MKLIDAFSSLDFKEDNLALLDEVSNHTFDCNCVPCLAFLVTTGLEAYGDSSNDPAWRKLRNTEVSDVYHIPEETLYQVRKLCDFYL